MTTISGLARTQWPAAWMKGLAQDTALLFSTASEGEFVSALRRFLAGVTSFDDYSIFFQKGDEHPVHIASSFEPKVLRTGVRNYLEATYVLDPYVSALQRGAPPGAYRGVDVTRFCEIDADAASDLPLHVSADEEIGFRTADWPESLSEMQVVFPISAHCAEGSCCQIGLYRHPGARGFEKIEADALSSLTPIIAGAFGQYWTRLAPHDASERLPAIYDLLSPREREVVDLVTRGFSSHAISALLNVGIETVKTHRKRAYRKLGICSQAELFALARPQIMA